MYVLMTLRVGKYRTNMPFISLLTSPSKSDIYFEILIYETVIQRHINMDPDPDKHTQSIMFWNQLPYVCVWHSYNITIYSGYVWHFCLFHTLIYSTLRSYSQWSNIDIWNFQRMHYDFKYIWSLYIQIITTHTFSLCLAPFSLYSQLPIYPNHAVRETIVQVSMRYSVAYLFYPMNLIFN